MNLFHPQLQQSINLFLLLIVGTYLSQMYLSWNQIIFLLVIVTVIEHSMIFIKVKQLTFFSFSALSTSIGVILMLVTTHLYIYVIVIGLGLLQKHFLTVQCKHFFNPSNFALLSALVLFYKDAHIVLGQLGDSVWLQIFVLLVAISILVRVSRWVIPLIFVLTYMGMQYVFIVQSDPVLIIDDIYHRFYSVSFIVFILFMLTDPKTTPQKPLAQVIFATLITSVAILLDYIYGFRVQHLFMALFLASILVPLYTSWEEKSKSQQLFFSTLTLLILALGAIIYVEIQAPYYFEMDG